MKASLIKKLKNIKILVVDVDGVLTAGDIIIDQDGQETKFFDVQDGFGLVFLMREGLKTAILSARSARCVERRAKDLGITKVYQDASPKIDSYKKILQDFQLKDSEVCFIGDDFPDVPVLKRVGFSVSVPNGRPEVKKVVDYVTKNSGGKGAVRELVEMILKAQGKWSKVLKKYEL